jgi:hypothetical protein
MKKRKWLWEINIVWIGHVKRYISKKIIIRRHASVILANGISDIQDRIYHLLLKDLILMKCFGNHIGLAAGRDGKKKDVQGHTIRDHSLKIINKIKGNLNGLIGEFKSISKK